VRASGKRSLAATSTGPVRWRGLAHGLLLAAALAGVSVAADPSLAAAAEGGGRDTGAVAAAVPAPVGGAKYAGSLKLNDAGSQLKSWNKTASYCPQNTGSIANGKVTASASGDLKLTTAGERGSCVALISPGAYSSGVIQADIDFPALPGKPGSIANWTGFWLTGPAWPADGELDAVEVEPIDGRSAVTWHSGYVPARLPVTSADLTPGWHTVDMVYAKGFFAVYYDGRQYTSYTSGSVTGRPLNIYLTMTDTPDNSWVESRIGGAPINSDRSSASLTVKYLRIWSYR
jgi:hypothetical protein